MKPDTTPTKQGGRLDLVGRAHLADPRAVFHTMAQYPPRAGFADLLRRFWIPTWSVPSGQEAPQRVLQHPVCLLVVTADYARFYGVVPGLATTTLRGDGWAAGVMCEPAAGQLLTRRPVAGFTDRFVDLPEVLGAAGEELTHRVRAAMAPDPACPGAHRATLDAFHETLGAYLPVDEEGLLVNHLVALVEGRPDLTRVAQLCAELELSERALQRLAHRRLGLSPKWLIQRRRLHEAAERLRVSPVQAAELAAQLGYADQPHFVRDFARVTGTTPGAFAAQHRR